MAIQYLKKSPKTASTDEHAIPHTKSESTLNYVKY